MKRCMIFPSGGVKNVNFNRSAVMLISYKSLNNFAWTVLIFRILN